MSRVGTEFSINDYLVKALDDSGSQFVMTELPESGDYNKTAEKYEEIAEKIHHGEDHLLTKGKDWWDFFGENPEIKEDTMIDLEGTCRVAFHWDVQLLSIPVGGFERYTKKAFHDTFGQIFDWTGIYQDVAFDFDYHEVPEEVLEEISNSTVKFGFRVHTEDILDGVIDREFFSKYRERIYMLDVDVPHIENYYVDTDNRFEEDMQKVFFSEAVDWLFSEDNPYYVNLHAKGVNDFKRKRERVLSTVQEIDTGWE